MRPSLAASGPPKPCDKLHLSRGGGGTPQCDRVIVVLGYSDGGRDAIHPICAARVERAGEISTAVDVVVLSGWARVAGTRSEAHLMEAAWSGVAAELVVDPDAFPPIIGFERLRASQPTGIVAH